MVSTCSTRIMVVLTPGMFVQVVRRVLEDPQRRGQGALGSLSTAYDHPSSVRITVSRIVCERFSIRSKTSRARANALHGPRSKAPPRLPRIPSSLVPGSVLLAPIMRPHTHRAFACARALCICLALASSDRPRLAFHPCSQRLFFVHSLVSTYVHHLPTAQRTTRMFAPSQSFI